LCREYAERLERVKPLVASALGEVGVAARLNKYQRFKLEQSDDLHDAYGRLVSKLEFLQGCDLEVVTPVRERHVSNPISRLLYVGIVLAIVSENYWGL
jgi:hypothetical protein